MIKIPLALIADYANISREGKLNILGIFGQILATAVPAIHSQMQLIFSIEADRGESNKDHTLKIELIDADNIQTPMKIEGKVKFGSPPVGEDVRFNQIIQLNNLQFNKFGAYSFKILVDGEVKTSIPLKVIKYQVPKA